MGSLAATRSRSCAPIGFCTAKFTPNFARVVAGPAFLRLRRFVLASSSGEADPPCARWNVLSSTRWQATVRRLSGRILQGAADGRGNCAETRNELGENFRRERLVSVALGHLGRVVQERRKPGAHAGNFRRAHSASPRSCHGHRPRLVKFGPKAFGPLLANALTTTRSTLRKVDRLLLKTMPRQIAEGARSAG